MACGRPTSAALDAFCMSVPKAELHVHIEGTLEPGMLHDLAIRNGLAPHFATVAEATAARSAYSCLTDFLSLYYEGCAVLLHRRDFADLALAYFRKAYSQGARHCEVMVDPQSHLPRGVSWEALLGGLEDARKCALAEMGLTSHLICCFLRHLGADAAAATLQDLLSDPARRSAFAAVGLDSNEIYDTPAPWQSLFETAAAAGLRKVCHAGEEESAAYMAAAIEILKLDRVDHGVRSLDDPDGLLARLAVSRMPLTTCPVSNLRLKVYDGCYAEKLGELLRSGACVTLNSDDPAFFLTDSGHGAYVGDNYAYAAHVGSLDLAAVAALAKASFRASFISEEEKEKHCAAVDRALATAMAPAATA